MQNNNNNQGKKLLSAIGGDSNKQTKRFSSPKDDNNAEALPRKIPKSANAPEQRTNNSSVLNSRQPVGNVMDFKPPAANPSSTSQLPVNDNAGEIRTKKPRNRSRSKKSGVSNDSPEEVSAPNNNTSSTNNNTSNANKSSEQQTKKGFSGSNNYALASSSIQMEVDNGEKPAYLTDKTFTGLDISSNTIRALTEVMKFRFMTRVQDESLPEILKGHDALVKAKTGTGKTVGFLVPSIEVLLKEKARVARTRDAPPAKILVLSPTRELAQQIAAEATALCTFHNMGITLLVGGTSMPGDVRALNRPSEGNSDIIVATPGRLVAHLKETPGFAAQVRGVKVFVMDEADRLLDMGFKKDIDDITNFLNRRDSNAHGKRQTLLFSATVANDIQQIARTTLLPGYKFIDTVGEEVEQTHAHVPQQVMVVPLDQQVRAIVSILEEQKRLNPEYKMILFFPTARQTGYYATILNSIGLKVLEIHSRKSQSQRTRTSEEFRAGKNVILLSSDVSARGMDYPDVSFVLQVGMTVRDQYIHRLGRTARAGKEGCGLLLLAPFEHRSMLQELDDMPLQEVRPSLDRSALAERAVQALVTIAQKDEAVVAFGEDSERDSAKMAWAAWLGYYNGWLKKLGMTKAGLVELSVSYATSIGLSQIPSLPKKTIGKMGMAGVPGLRIETAAEAKPQAPRGGGGGGGRGGGGNAGRGAPQQQSQGQQGRPQTAASSQQKGGGQQQQQQQQPPRASVSAGGGRPQQNSGGRGSGRR